MSGPWWVVLLVGAGGAVAGWVAGSVVAEELDGPRERDRVALTAGTGAGWAVAAAYLGASWALPAVLYLVVLAGALTAADVRAHRLPNRLVLGSYPVVAGLLVLSVADSTRAWTAVATAGAWGLGLFVLLLIAAATGPVGGGDIKLAGLVGAYLGWAGGGTAVLLGILVTALSAAIVAAAGLALRQMSRDSALAYGPFLLLGALVGVAVTLP